MPNDEPSQGWWHTVPGILTAIAGLITAVGGLLTILVQAGIIGSGRGSGSDVNTPVSAPAAASASESSIGTPSRPTTGNVESRLEQANIQLSTGSADDLARVRGSMSDPGGAYALLADACLDVLGERRLKRRGHLDMIDKWYTIAVGQDRYLTETGTIRSDELRSAIVKATNEIHGTTAISFDEVVE